MHQCVNVNIKLCYFAAYAMIFMKFSPKCRATYEFEILITILGSFCSFLNSKGVYIGPQNRSRKIPVKR